MFKNSGSVQEIEGEACTGGGASTGVERRGLYRRWQGKPVLLKKIRNWVGGGRTGEYKNRMWFRLSGRILTTIKVVSNHSCPHQLLFAGIDGGNDKLFTLFLHLGLFQ
jgi:hypothetical protein